MREERPQSASEQDETAHEIVAEAEPSFFADPKRLIQTAVAVVLLLVAIYVLIPKIFDLQDALGKIDQGDPVWIAVGVAFCVVMFAAYVALFRGVVGEKVIHLEWGESYQITMAGLAATRLFSAGGAGGILLTYWALRKAGMERRQSVCRMVAFLVVLYSVYLAALVIFGVLLRTGVLSGDAPLSGTVIPAALAALAIVIGLLIALLPDDFERRIERHTSGRFGRIAKSDRHRSGHLCPGHAYGHRLRPPSERGRAGLRWRDRVLGGQHRHPLGELPRLRRLGAPGGRDPGLLPRHAREPDSVRARRGRAPSTPE